MVEWRTGRTARQFAVWVDGESVMQWWIGEDPRMKYQLSFMDFIEENGDV